MKDRQIDLKIFIHGPFNTKETGTKYATMYDYSIGFN